MKESSLRMKEFSLTGRERQNCNLNNTRSQPQLPKSLSLANPRTRMLTRCAIQGQRSLGDAQGPAHSQGGSCSLLRGASQTMWAFREVNLPYVSNESKAAGSCLEDWAQHLQGLS